MSDYFGGSDEDEDQWFNFRDPRTGLNFDFMTYSMYTKAGKDPTALLNVTTLQDFAQDIFSTFFQHFVSSNLSLTTGGWAYQVVNATLPAIGKPIEEQMEENENINSGKDGEETEYSTPHSRTNRTTIVEVSTPIEVLDMNAVAVWLSTAILVWLILATIMISALQHRYLRNLGHNVDCIGDVLVLVAGSDRLLRLVNERGPAGLDGEKNIFTKLGQFEDEGGRQRWGIEVVEVPGEPYEDTEASEEITRTLTD